MAKHNRSKQTANKNPINRTQTKEEKQGTKPSYPITQEKVNIIRIQQQLIQLAEVNYMALRSALQSTIMQETGQDLYEGDWLLDLDEGTLQRA